LLFLEIYQADANGKREHFGTFVFPEQAGEAVCSEKLNIAQADSGNGRIFKWIDVETSVVFVFRVIVFHFGVRPQVEGSNHTGANEHGIGVLVYGELKFEH
jgi:hypothetical protein